MKVAYLNKDNDQSAVAELKKILATKWERRDRLKAEKKLAARRAATSPRQV